MISAHDFLDALRALWDQGEDDVAWAQSLQAPATPEEFALEIVFVICNSGMKNTVARGIFQRCRDILVAGGNVKGAILGKSGKAAAIDSIWSNREALYKEYCDLRDDNGRLEYLGDLPWVGGITKFHCAKNFGLVHLCKPDVHLQRLADHESVTPQALCERLQGELAALGHRYNVAAIDTVLLRACANGVIDSNTGKIGVKAP